MPASASVCPTHCIRKRRCNAQIFIVIRTTILAQMRREWAQDDLFPTRANKRWFLSSARGILCLSPVFPRMYFGIKLLHIFLLIFSVILFEFRFFIKVFRGVRPEGLLKVAPHVIDSLLLLSGVYLLMLGGLSFLEEPWLQVKLVALVLYIGFGLVAMKKTGSTAHIGFILATVTVIYMVMTAITKDPLFFVG